MLAVPNLSSLFNTYLDFADIGGAVGGVLCQARAFRKGRVGVFKNTSLCLSILTNRSLWVAPTFAFANLHHLALARSELASIMVPYFMVAHFGNAM